MYPDIFNAQTTEALVQRIERLTPETSPEWGKMSINEMLAHCSLAYEYNNGQRETKVPKLMKWLLSGMMKKTIAGPKPYKRNSPTASYFKVSDPESFETEKIRLLRNVRSFQEAGPEAAVARNHAWIGKMIKEEWSTTMYKHIDHHLQQFGV